SLGGAGAVRLGLPSGVRGIPGVGRPTHCACRATDASATAVMVARIARCAFIPDPPPRLRRHTLSILHAPGPAVHRNKNKKQNRIEASMPACWKLGQNPLGAHDLK